MRYYLSLGFSFFTALAVAAMAPPYAACQVQIYCFILLSNGLDVNMPCYLVSIGCLICSVLFY